MKRLVLIFLILFGFCNLSHAAITTTAYNTPDDVTIDALESNRVTFTDAINSADGGLLQDESVTAAKLDDNANPEVRWDEGFNDFVFTGLTIPTSADLTTTTTSGIAYILGTRVVKAATGKTYTGSRYTYVDLSNNGTYTYQEITFGATVPSVTTNSIRLARVSTDATTVLQVDDERVTQITIAAGSAGSIADTDADTGIKTEQADDEDIEQPLARISIKRFANETGQSLALPERTVYGNAPQGFIRQVRNWLESRQKDLPKGTYKRKGGYWSDTYTGREYELAFNRLCSMIKTACGNRGWYGLMKDALTLMNFLKK